MAYDFSDATETQKERSLRLSGLIHKSLSTPIEPTHYKGLDPEPIDVIEEWGLGYHLGSAMKYIARAGKKEGNPVEQDLRKAVWFIERYIQLSIRNTGYRTTIAKTDGEVWRQEDVLGS